MKTPSLKTLYDLRYQAEILAGSLSRLFRDETENSAKRDRAYILYGLALKRVLRRVKLVKEHYGENAAVNGYAEGIQFLVDKRAQAAAVLALARWLRWILQGE